MPEVREVRGCLRPAGYGQRSVCGCMLAKMSPEPANRHRYQRIAGFYDLLDLPFEYGRYRRFRSELFRGLSGRILDAGVGTGRNFPFYPSGAKVTGVDFSPAMLARARRRMHQSHAQVELCEMDITRLAFPNGQFDAVAATFVFCVLPDALQPAALRELRRVVKPDGTVRLLEYVRPRSPVRRLIARLWQPWIAWAFGAGFDRRTEEHIRDAGLEIVSAGFAVHDLIKRFDLRVRARSPAERSGERAGHP